MQVDPVQAVDLVLDRLVLTDASQHIFVEHGVGESKLLLVVLSAETVGRGLVYQVLRESQHVADLAHFMNQKMGQRAEIAGCVAVLGGIAHIILGRIAGVDDSCTAGEHLADRIERRHAKPGRKIDLGIPCDAVCAAQRQKVLAACQHGLHRLEGVADIELHIGNAEEFHELSGIRNVALHAVGHQNADNAILAERLCAQRRRDAGILAAGNSDDSLAAFAVLFKIVSDPLYDFILVPASAACFALSLRFVSYFLYETFYTKFNPCHIP